MVILIRSRSITRTDVGGNYRPYGNIYSYSTIGQIEQGGRGQIDIVGLLKQGRSISAERRATVSMEIENLLLIQDLPLSLQAKTKMILML